MLFVGVGGGDMVEGLVLGCAGFFFTGREDDFRVDNRLQRSYINR